MVIIQRSTTQDKHFMHYGNYVTVSEDIVLQQL